MTDEKIVRILPVPLTEEELVSIGSELSGFQIEKEKLESEKAAMVKDYNDQIKGKEMLISGLAHQINVGTKDVEVECYWTPDDPEEGKKSLFRSDNSELVEIKEMDLLDLGTPPEFALNVAENANE